MGEKLCTMGEELCTMGEGLCTMGEGLCLEERFGCVVLIRRSVYG